MIKVCTVCGKGKLIEEFFKAKRQKSGYHSACKVCHTNQVRLWRKNNPDEIKLIQSTYNRRNWKKYKKTVQTWRKKNLLQLKTEIYEHYCKGNPRCACCGEDQFKFLSIDHIKNDGASHRKTIFGNSRVGGGIRFYKWIINNNFPVFLQILCMNCNYGKRINGGICPHKI